MVRKTILVLLFLLPLGGCYYFQQGWALMQTYGSGQPIESVLADPSLDAQSRKFLEEAMKARRFALASLGLRENNNYTTFVQLDRDYLAAVVSACRPLAFEQFLWFHPVVGEVPYQGYFDLDGARAEATRLRAEGWDVWIRAVDAFSTLGWFQDPLFSFMTDYAPGAIAELLIHEQTHATVWVENQADFNESLAVIVGRAGAEAYLSDHYGADSAELKEYLERRSANEDFMRLFTGLKKDLEAVYGTERPDSEKLEEKAARIESFKQALPEPLARWKEAEINNAVLATFGNYESRTAEVEAYLAACGSLRAMLERLERLDRRHPDPWQWMLEDAQSLQNPEPDVPTPPSPEDAQQPS